MPSITLREHESLDAALRKLKRLCEKANILSSLRRNERYEKKTTKRKRARMAAEKRHKKKLQKSNEIMMRNRPKHRPNYYNELKAAMESKEKEQSSQ